MVLLESAVRSTYRFLLKRNKLFQFENVLLNFIRKDLSKINSNSELVSSFKIIRSKLQVFLKDPFERQPLDHFDFISWLESKIENISFEEAIKRKVVK